MEWIFELLALFLLGAAIFAIFGLKPPRGPWR